MSRDFPFESTIELLDGGTLEITQMGPHKFAFRVRSTQPVSRIVRQFIKKVSRTEFADPREVDEAITLFQLALRNAQPTKNERTINAPDVAASDETDPPKIAEFLLTALSSPSRGEAMVGDLNERFARDCEKLGRDRAVLLYWARTLRSLWPLLRRAIGKALKWGAVIAAVRRIF